MASLIAVLGTGELRAILSTVAVLAHTLAIHTHATVVTVARTSELATVFSGVALFTVAGAIDTASTIITVIWTDEFGAVKACPWLVANTLIFHAASTAQAVVEAVGLAAVLTDEALLT